MSLEMVGFGFAVGLLVGLTGTGGGSVMTPLLILLFGINPATAIGTDIAYSAVEKGYGGVRQWRAGNVDMSLAKRIACGSVPGAVAGVILLKILERDLGSNFETVLFTVLGAILILTGAALLARIVFGSPDGTETDEVELTRARTVQAIVLGAFVGLAVGVTSAGSGALVSAGIIFLFRLRPARVVGTDLFSATIVLWTAGICHVIIGDIDYGLAGTLLVGAVPGIILSTMVALRAPQGPLRIALGVILIGAALGMFTKAGIAIPSPVLAIAPAIVLIVVVGGFVREARGRGRVVPRLLDSA